jgi:Arc/MetJ-type ribon-helix-helix transcriptional regulator
MEKSHQFKSTRLSALAMRIQAGPFDKVLEMIRNLVSKLQAEAVAEAERHGVCEAMKAEQKLDVEDKTEQKEDLANQKASLESKIAQLTEEIATLNNELSILTQDKGEATKQRAADKAENAKQIKEAKEGQAALNDAIQVLESFYSGSAAHAAENETVAEDNATTLDTPVYGGSSSSGSVIEMMKQIADDFARQEAESTAAESQQASEYKTLMNASEVDVASKTTSRDFKKKQLADSKKQHSMVSGEFKNASEALDAALKQQEATKKQCDGNISFEERMEQRDNEIQSLKEALEVLKNYS